MERIADGGYPHAVIAAVIAATISGGNAAVSLCTVIGFTLKADDSCSILQESSAFNVKPITVHNETAALPPEIVAAITAAITACGYPPSAIRSIKPERQRTSNWIMAARMIGMR